MLIMFKTKEPFTSHEVNGSFLILITKKDNINCDIVLKTT